MIETNLLAQFVAFAKAGTLTRAAQDLHTSQPALTRSMKKLEEELEVPLFVRHKNHLELTQTGRYAVYYAQRVLQENQDFCDRIALHRLLCTGPTNGADALAERNLPGHDLIGRHEGRCLLPGRPTPPDLSASRHACPARRRRVLRQEMRQRKTLSLGPRIGPPGLLSGSPPAGPGWPGYPALFSYRLLDENDSGKDTSRPLFIADPAGYILGTVRTLGLSLLFIQLLSQTGTKNSGPHQYCSGGPGMPDRLLLGLSEK